MAVAVTSTCVEDAKPCGTRGLLVVCTDVERQVELPELTDHMPMVRSPCRWIESLNSVLDDNRLLTMPNGERIQFANNVNFIFECHRWADTPAPRIGCLRWWDEGRHMSARTQRTQSDTTYNTHAAWSLHHLPHSA